MEILRVDSNQNTQVIWQDDQSDSNSNLDRLRAICSEINMKGELLDQILDKQELEDWLVKTAEYTNGILENGLERINN
jgi:hypothetical protein